jgi:hypothetical protein
MYWAISAPKNAMVTVMNSQFFSHSTNGRVNA